MLDRFAPPARPARAVLLAALLLSGFSDLPFATLETSPRADAAGVLGDAGISVVFTRPVNPSTLDARTFSVEGVEGSVRYDARTRTATFRPHSPLSEGTRYTVTLSELVQDLSGQALEGGRSWSFTTAGGMTFARRTTPARQSSWTQGGAHPPGELGAVLVRGPSDVKSLAAGRYFSLALMRDGTVWAWGANDSGQLGDGTTVDRDEPVRVRRLTGIIAISAGAEHAMALRKDGTVWTWGSNGAGQIGNGDFGPAPDLEGDKHVVTPWRVSRLARIVAIDAGRRSSRALESDGTSWTWGEDEDAEDGRSARRSPTPTRLPGLSGASAVGYEAVATSR